jgi:hypothetical protein
MPDKLLIVLQYNYSEEVDATEVLDAISKTLPAKNPFADLFVYVRYNAEFPHRNFCLSLEEKFDKTYAARSNGPFYHGENADNEMFVNLLKLLNETPQFSQYKAALLIDKTCFPITKDWLEVLSKEWDESRCHYVGQWKHENSLYGDPTNCVGSINRIAMISPTIAKHRPQILGAPRGSSWHETYSTTLRDLGWQGTYAIKESSISPTKDEILALRNEHCVLVFGAKNKMAIKSLLLEDE